MKVFYQNAIDIRRTLVAGHRETYIIVDAKRVVPLNDSKFTCTFHFYTHADVAAV